MSAPLLPADRPNQIYVTVKAFCAGKAHLPHSLVFEDCKGEPDSVGVQIPVLCFLITHPTKGHAVFDLGIRKDAKGHPPANQEAIDRFSPTCEHDAAEILLSGGVEPTDISFIIYSHLHWDHVGDPTRFTSAEFVLGADAVSLLSSAYPANPSSPYMALPAWRPVRYVRFAPEDDHAPFGPFAHAIDFHGDGSLYLVDAPGHSPGHLTAAARVGPGAFVFLAGDVCHNRAGYAPGARVLCAHPHDLPEVARDTVERLKRLEREYAAAVVILAHEKEREEEMPMFPLELNGWAMEEVKKREGSMKTRSSV